MTPVERELCLMRWLLTGIAVGVGVLIALVIVLMDAQGVRPQWPAVGFYLVMAAMAVGLYSLLTKLYSKADSSTRRGIRP